MTQIDQASQPKFRGLWFNGKERITGSTFFSLSLWGRVGVGASQQIPTLILGNHPHPSPLPEGEGTKKSGFTLIELSIVLVIIGLIVGGVLTGRDLIRAAEIRSITADYEKFKTAVNTFKLKYDAIPGDMANAQTYFGAATPDCATAQTTTATCNGTGNGLIDSSTTSGTIGNEQFLFWKHLANAGLIAGNFTGITDGSNTWSSTTNNSPSGKISGSLWYSGYWGIKSGVAWAFDGVYNNSFEYGLSTVNSDPTLILTASEMRVLDSKIDDGKPGTGNLRAVIAGTCSVKATDGVTAAVSADATTAIYNTTSTGKQCTLLFPNVF